MTVHQPLYTMGKTIQWTNPESFIGAKSFAVMMGGLHIEMTYMKCLGKLRLSLLPHIFFSSSPYQYYPISSQWSISITPDVEMDL